MRSNRLRPNTTHHRPLGTENDKSSVDDFDMEQGIVRARVGLSYDPLRLSLCSYDLYETNTCVVPQGQHMSPPPYIILYINV